MKKYDNYIGIDVSKDTLDVSVVRGAKEVFNSRIINDLKSLSTLEKELKKNGILAKNSLVCVEHTGIYTKNVLLWKLRSGFSVWLESGMQIKKSLGLTRGKNDKIDAYRIAMYAFRFEDKCRLWEAPREAVQRLRAFFTLLNRLKDSKKKLKVPLQESKKFLSKEQQKELEKHSKAALQGVEKSLKETEKKMLQIIKEDAQINKLYGLVTSNKGIGFVTATALIVFTNEFKNFNKASQLACYIGVVPFEYSSGKFVSKGRVSHFANKTLKSLMHMAARSAMQHNKKMREYSERKLAQGKHKMSVVNAVRNKLIRIICACVNNGKKYEENYTRKLA